MTVRIQIKKLREIPLPAYMTPGAAAMDVCAAVDEPLMLPPHTPVMVPLGFAVAIPEGYMGLIFGRSSLGAKYGVCPSNAVGVIDADYRGELMINLINHTDTPVTLEPGARVGQLAIVPVAAAVWEECDALPATSRGDGGYGSTGR
ncbi:MAG: dUTP diphosphatase [Clostridiales bacterium]|jgi:dUTP pyrophosphatase|nr:dUTP diphosphatase [Clostridiales bacterium]